ncbi:hypothetical protein AVEN_199898-1 [Araneus ventricosus]|uniref:Uncharacterized protein n=1 Tax=Araneus ventricosus TaxID=182803 RepID=A0A4Y2HNS1_ARAVE|nr:hypothetical protein AVEN_199898-1 [Araneus ventricosus]
MGTVFCPDMDVDEMGKSYSVGSRCRRNVERILCPDSDVDEMGTLICVWAVKYPHQREHLSAEHFLNDGDYHALDLIGNHVKKLLNKEENFNNWFKDCVQDRGGLVVGSRLWGRRAPGSKPDSTENPPCMGPASRQIIRSSQMSSRWCSMEDWRRGCQLGCRPHHLTVVKNYEVRPTIALVLLRNGTLI